VRAYVRNGVFLTPELNIDATSTSIDAVATTMDGLVGTASVVVSVSNTAASAQLETDTPVGYAPLPAKFAVSVPPGSHVQNVSIDFDGNGTADYVGSSAGYVTPFTYAQPGIYTATATITLDTNQQVSAQQKVMVLDLAEQRTNICSVYAHLRARLAAQDVSGA
jgi:hypothetical protein